MIENWVGVGAFLGQIRDSLKSGEFRPAEVRQVMIPKSNTGKFRKLGIPTIADRVVQASLKRVRLSEKHHIVGCLGYAARLRRSMVSAS